MYRHALRNALNTIITVFSNVCTAAIGGSGVIEYLFGIPGMGPEILSAVHAGDFSMMASFRFIRLSSRRLPTTAALSSKRIRFCSRLVTKKCLWKKHPRRSHPGTSSLQLSPHASIEPVFGL
jgi:hypothetical protein